MTERRIQSDLGILRGLFHRMPQDKTLRQYIARIGRRLLIRSGVRLRKWGDKLVWWGL